MKKANMKEMACEERPYERCEQFGASNLTDSAARIHRRQKTESERKRRSAVDS